MNKMFEIKFLQHFQMRKLHKTFCNFWQAHFEMSKYQGEMTPTLNKKLLPGWIDKFKTFFSSV